MKQARRQRRQQEAPTGCKIVVGGRDATLSQRGPLRKGRYGGEVLVTVTHLADDPCYQLGALLNQARDAVRKVREREVAQYGLTAVQTSVLFVIDANGGETTIATIAAWLLREAHTVSDLLSRMEALGFTSKTRSPNKRSELTIRMTPKGEEAFRKATSMELSREVYCVLDEEEREQLSSYLRRIRDKALAQLVIEEQGAPYP